MPVILFAILLGVCGLPTLGLVVGGSWVAICVVVFLIYLLGFA